MKLFLDSADPQEIDRFARWGVIDGVTTTPTFFRRLGVENAREHVARIAARFPGEIHVEALGRDADELVAAARANRELGPNLVSKIPIGPAALEATRRLAEEGIRVNLHLVFSVSQAVLGAKAGAAYLCPLLGRMSDAGLEAIQLIEEMVELLELQLPETTLMVSSIRNPDDARRALLTGAGAVTIPGVVLRQMLESPHTDRAARILAEDSLHTSAVSQAMRSLESLPVLAPGTPLAEAISGMTRLGIGIAAVLADGAVAGVLTDGDLRRIFAEDGATARGRSVEAVMTRSFQSVGPDSTLRSAVETMQRCRIAELLVCHPESGAPLGVLSLHDLLLAGGRAG